MLFLIICYDHTTNISALTEILFCPTFDIQNATSTLSLMTAVSSLCNPCRFRYFPKSARLKIILSLRRNPLTLIQRWRVRKSHTVKVYSVTSDTSKWEATYYSECSQWSTGWHHQTRTVTGPHCLLFRWWILYLHIFFPMSHLQSYYLLERYLFFPLLVVVWYLFHPNCINFFTWLWNVVFFVIVAFLCFPHTHKVSEFWLLTFKKFYLEISCVLHSHTSSLKKKNEYKNIWKHFDILFPQLLSWEMSYSVSLICMSKVRLSHALATTCPRTEDMYSVSLNGHRKFCPLILLAYYCYFQKVVEMCTGDTLVFGEFCHCLSISLPAFCCTLPPVWFYSGPHLLRLYNQAHLIPISSSPHRLAAPLLHCSPCWIVSVYI